MAAQVAGDEPVSAENSAQAPILEITREPGTRCSQRDSASYKSLPARELATAAPMMMNIGSDTSVKSLRPANTVSGTKCTLFQPSNATINSSATAPSPKAIGIPVASTTTVARKINDPIASALMATPVRWRFVV